MGEFLISPDKIPRCRRWQLEWGGWYGIWGQQGPAFLVAVYESARFSRWVLAELGQTKPCLGPIPETLGCKWVVIREGAKKATSADLVALGSGPGPQALLPSTPQLPTIQIHREPVGRGRGSVVCSGSCVRSMGRVWGL